MGSPLTQFLRRRSCWIPLAASMLFSLNAELHANVEVAEREISITLQQMPTSNTATIAVELDGYDVSRFVELTDDGLVIRLGSAIAPGQHSLQVLYFHDNGDISTLLDQSIELQSAATISQWAMNSTLNSSYRAAEKEKVDYQGVNHTAANGGLQWRSQHQQGSWFAETQVDAIYDSLSENNIDGDEWALPNALFALGYQAEDSRIKLGAGNIQLQREDLLFSYYQRRGVDLSITDLSDSVSLQLFGTHSEPSTLYNSQLDYPEQSTNRSSGATAAVALFKDYLRLSAGFVEGESSLSGAGYSYFEEPTVYGGESWNVALDSKWLNSSLWLRAEYAESEFDNDGVDLGNDAEEDHASQAMIQFSSNGDLGAGLFDYWSGYLQAQSVGLNYYSLGNLSLPGDLELLRGQFQAGKGGLALDLQWSEEENNIDDNPFLPTQTLQRQGVSVNYTPMDLNFWPAMWQLLGYPSLFVSYYETDHSQPDDEATTAGYDFDNQTKESSINLMFTRDTFNWGLQYQQVETDDQTTEIIENGYYLYVPLSDNENGLTALQLGWTPSEYFSTSAFLQWSRQEETDFGNVYRNRSFGVDTYVHLIPETLNLLVNYNLGRDQASYSQEGFVEDNLKSQFVNMQLTWNAIKANQNHPSLDLYMRSSYGKQDDQGFLINSEQWAMYVGFESSFAAGDQ
jgi:hypothetical protein